jgi:N-acetylmuramoyl-L-alanine amidase
VGIPHFFENRYTQPVTRAKLMAVLPIAAEFRLSAGMQRNLVAKEPSKTFSDIENYWAASIITQMSFYCSVAAALNEMGNRFAFDDSAKRNYAVATLRMLKCVKAQ